jgi:hypothetical protein
MSKLCPICGAELVDGKCPNQESHIKYMCLNCKHCVYHEEDDKYRCHSEANMTKAMNKIASAINVGELGYEIKLSPLPLKNPTKKCVGWYHDKDKILNALLPYTTTENKES